MTLDPPDQRDNGSKPADDSPFDLTGETPPDELGTTPAGVAVCLYEHFPDAGSPALELFDPETLDRTVETFEAVEDAESRFRELTGGGPETDGEDAA